MPYNVHLTASKDRHAEKFTPAKADPILGLGKLFAADERTGKIDLGVGVYKDPTATHRS